MKITGAEILLEEILGKKHITVEEAFDVLMQFTTETGELSETLYNQVAKKLTEEEQDLLVSLLTGKGIKVLPIEVKIKAQEILIEDEKRIEDEVEKVKQKILEALNDAGEISQEKLEKILSEIYDPLVSARVSEWVMATPLVRIKNEKKGNTNYRERIKKKVKKITGVDALLGVQNA